MTLVGNDVVDLRDPRCAAKASDDRFVRRVLAAPEASRIRAAGDPNRMLWIHWAAKEAAFKVISKVLGTPPPFEHAAFVFEPASPDAPPAPGESRWAHRWDEDMAPRGSEPRRGRVRYRDREIFVRLDIAPDRIHALGWFQGDREPEDVELHRRVHLAPGLSRPAPEGWRKPLRDRLSEREWSSVHHPASALVRLEARSDFARVTGLPEPAIEIVCDEGPPGRMPPRILHSGTAHPADLTLSHHGRFLAWAFAVPSRSRFGGTPPGARSDSSPRSGDRSASGTAGRVG